MNDHHPHPHPQADPLEWGRRVQPRVGGEGGSSKEEGGAHISIEILTEGRRRVPAVSLKLGNTGFARSLADKRRMSQWSTDIA